MATTMGSFAAGCREFKEVVMAESLTESMRDTIQSAARKLSGFLRRQFQAEITTKYGHGSTVVNV